MPADSEGVTVTHRIDRRAALRGLWSDARPYAIRLAGMAALVGLTTNAGWLGRAAVAVTVFAIGATGWAAGFLRGVDGTDMFARRERR